MDCCLFGTKPLSEPILQYCQFKEHISVKFNLKSESFNLGEMYLKSYLQNGGHFVSASTH